jgi:hypothetical protein
MDRDELTVLLLDLERKHGWRRWNIFEYDDGRVKFTVERLTRNSEIYLNSFDEFTDFVAVLAAS